jgi:DNA repair exonuclease SbcCD ATPase subunit
MSFDDYKQRIEQLKARRQLAAEHVDREQVALQEAQDEEQSVLEAQRVAQAVAQAVQQQAHEQIARVVSRSLAAVFDDPYEFRVHFEQKRGKTEARLSFERNGFQVDPLSAAGGGVVDVAAFALRLACLMLSRPPRRRLLILDEPFRFLSVENCERMRQLLELLSEEMDVQFVITTHQRRLRAGKVVELE